MGGIKFKVEGLSDLVDSLEELKKSTSTGVQKRALKQAAEPIEADAKRLAPRRTGKLQEDITIGTKLSSRQKAASPKQSKIEIYIGPPSMPRAIISEFGSVKQSARPYMRPAWDSNKRPALTTIRGILADEIEKTRQRLARKAARLLTTRGS
jgi:HK97 gp10 family phage protein